MGLNPRTGSAVKYFPGLSLLASSLSPAESSQQPQISFVLCHPVHRRPQMELGTRHLSTLGVLYRKRAVDYQVLVILVKIQLNSLPFIYWRSDKSQNV